MTPVLLPKHELHSEAWHEARRSRLGGSEIAAVLGLSPWQSPFSLWHLKAGLIEPDPPNRFTEWGNRLEPVVAAKFLDEHPEMTGEHLPQGDGFSHSDRPWQSASPDVYLHDRNSSINVMQWATTFCEVKTAARADTWADGIPIYYRTQVLWTMDVLGVDHAYLAALIGGSDYREYFIELDDDAEADLTLMRTAGETFMASLTAGTPPDIDSSDVTLTTIRKLHPDIDPNTEQEIDRTTADTYTNAKDALDSAKADYNRARSAVARPMLNRQYAVCEGERIARRQPDRFGGPPVLYPVRKAALPKTIRSIA